MSALVEIGDFDFVSIDPLDEQCQAIIRCG
jgi:hypothetical protein